VLQPRGYLSVSYSLALIASFIYVPAKQDTSGKELYRKIQHLNIEIPSYWINAQSDATYNGQDIDGAQLMGKGDALMIVTSVHKPNEPSNIWAQGAQFKNVQVQP